jgi:hypothetical protein
MDGFVSRSKRHCEGVKKGRPPKSLERLQGSYFHDPHLMNNPTKTATGNEKTSQASSSSLPVPIQLNGVMPQLSH